MSTPHTRADQKSVFRGRSFAIRADGSFSSTSRSRQRAPLRPRLLFHRKRGVSCVVVKSSKTAFDGGFDAVLVVSPSVASPAVCPISVADSVCQRVGFHRKFGVRPRSGIVPLPSCPPTPFVRLYSCSPVLLPSFILSRALRVGLTVTLRSAVSVHRKYGAFHTLPPLFSSYSPYPFPLPFHSLFISFHSLFTPFHSLFTPFHSLFTPLLTLRTLYLPLDLSSAPIWYRPRASSAFHRKSGVCFKTLPISRRRSIPRG